MSLDFTYDYSKHDLIDNTYKYDKLYKLTEVEGTDIQKGDLILLKTPCGEYNLFIATADSSEEDATLHLSKYLEFNFTKFEKDTSDNSESSCGTCNCTCKCNSH